MQTGQKHTQKSVSNPLFKSQHVFVWMGFHETRMNNSMITILCKWGHAEQRYWCRNFKDTYILFLSVCIMLCMYIGLWVCWEVCSAAWASWFSIYSLLFGGGWLTSHSLMEELKQSKHFSVIELYEKKKNNNFLPSIPNIHFSSEIIPMLLVY